MVNFSYMNSTHRLWLTRMLTLIVTLIMTGFVVTTYATTIFAANECSNKNPCNNRAKECVRGSCEDKKNGGGNGGGGNNGNGNNGNNGGSGTNTAPATSTSEGSDLGTSDSSDPDPARVGNEDCAIDGVANAGAKTDIGLCIPKNPMSFASEFYKVGISLIGGLSVIFIIFGGYILLTSQGNAERLKNGKTFIFYAVFGLLLAIFGYVFIEVIAIDILHLPGFTR